MRRQSVCLSANWLTECVAGVPWEVVPKTDDALLDIKESGVLAQSGPCVLTIWTCGVLAKQRASWSYLCSIPLLLQKAVTSRLCIPGEPVYLCFPDL